LQRNQLTFHNVIEKYSTVILSIIILYGSVYLHKTAIACSI